MKTLLAIIAAASLVVGCGVFEEEQTTIDATSGGTTSAPTGGGDSTPTVAVFKISGGIAETINHTCAIKTDGTAQCWGDDSAGQSTIPADLGTVISISARDDNTCIVKSNNAVQCWGNDDAGQSTVPAELQ